MVSKAGNILGAVAEKFTAYDAQDAYSFKQMGYVVADAFLAGLKSIGITDDKDLEEVFRSKHARWFMGGNDSAIAKYVTGLSKKYCVKNAEELKKLVGREK